MLRLSESLPILVKFVENHEQIKKTLPTVQEMVKIGLITTETVDVAQYG